MMQLGFRLVRPLYRQQSWNLNIIRYASNNVTKVSKSSNTPSLPKSKLIKSRSATPGEVSTTRSPDQIRKEFAARKLYEAGQRAIYRAPSHVGLLSASYIISGTSLGIALGLFFTGHWQYDPNSELHWIVGVGWRLGMAMFSGAAALAIIRMTRCITAIDLVSHNENVKLVVSVRRAIPFLSPKKYTIAPYDFRMSNTMVEQMHVPEWFSEEAASKSGAITGIGRGISKAFFYPFAAFRKLFTHEGIMKVTIGESKEWARLDTTGKFSNAANDLIEIATVEE